MPKDEVPYDEHDVEEMLDRYIDGQGDPAWRRAIEARLESDPELRASLAELILVRTVMDLGFPEGPEACDRARAIRADPTSQDWTRGDESWAADHVAGCPSCDAYVTLRSKPAIPILGRFGGF